MLHALVLGALLGASNYHVQDVHDPVEGEWLALFDSVSAAGWRIDGDWEVANGALVLGGARTTRAYSPVAPLRGCRIRFSYRTEGAASAGLGWDAPGQPGVPVPHLSPRADWQETSVEEYGDVRSFGPRFLKAQHGENAVPRTMDALWVEVPAGTRLLLRDVRSRPAPRAPWPRGAALALLATGGGLAATLAWLRARRQRLPRPGAVD